LICILIKTSPLFFHWAQAAPTRYRDRSHWQLGVVSGDVRLCTESSQPSEFVINGLANDTEWCLCHWHDRPPTPHSSGNCLTQLLCVWNTFICHKMGQRQIRGDVVGFVLQSAYCFHS